MEMCIACDPKWFGSSCQYKCRCTDNKCNVTVGTCTNGAVCQEGWFGPACQYVDLAYNKSTVQQITDGDDNTCLTPSGLDNVTIMLDNLYRFTWLRVHVNTSYFLHSLGVKFKNDSSLSCLNTRNSTVDDTTLDIYCDLNETFQSVTLTGEGVPYLCSVYISGGRNVALKQKTTQSGTYTEGGISYSSDKAVDGNTSGNFLQGKSCAHTDPYKDDPNWIVTLSPSQNINRYVLYNRNDNLRRLRRFVLQSFDAAGNQLFKFTDTSPDDHNTYTVTSVGVTSPISLVNIHTNNSERILTLCEVEIYGDSSCASRHYGRECEHKCNCAGDESCFVSTGGCPSGCAAGFYGEECIKPCDSDKYGKSCKMSCSQFCIRTGDIDDSVCNRFDGTCLHGCQIGYEGSDCIKPCDPGKFGPGCNSTCRNYCVFNQSAERSCSNINGTCLSGCVDGYQGLTCDTECDPGTYGMDCDFTCSKFCTHVNGFNATLCNHVNGHCNLGCLSGYTSPLCVEAIKHGPTSQDDKDIIIPAVLGTVAVVVVVVLVVILVILWRRYKAVKSQLRSTNDINGRINRNPTEFTPDTTYHELSVRPSKFRPTAEKTDYENETTEGHYEIPGVYYNAL